MINISYVVVQKGFKKGDKLFLNQLKGQEKRKITGEDKILLNDLTNSQKDKSEDVMM